MIGSDAWKEDTNKHLVSVVSHNAHDPLIKLFVAMANSSVGLCQCIAILGTFIIESYKRVVHRYWRSDSGSSLAKFKATGWIYGRHLPKSIPEPIFYPESQHIPWSRSM